MDLRCLKSKSVLHNGFGFAPEKTAKIARTGWRSFEVPISYSGRTYAEGKKITWIDGIKGIYCTVKCAASMEFQMVPL
jgi:hypothetical protein